MKKYYSLAVACIVMAFCSCNKEDLNGTVLNSTSSSNTSSTAAITTKFVPSKMVNYGALIGVPTIQGSMDFQLNVADQIGISCLRSRTLVPSTAPVSILNSTYKVLLNFNSDYEGTPLPFATDLGKYQSDLKNILSRFITKPVVAVIENEESNSLYYSGTAQDYIRQLTSAIGVMHSYGIKVANGGITTTGLNYLVYQDFMNQGKYDSAQLFKQLARVTPRSAKTQERGAFVNTLLQAYAKMGLDYVNFHWKGTSPDTRALSMVINYMKKVTHKAIINNELGQFDTDPNTLLTHVQQCTDSGLAYVIWYSPDENSANNSTPLQHSDASLTPSGTAYKGYLHN